MGAGLLSGFSAFARSVPVGLGALGSDFAILSRGSAFGLGSLGCLAACSVFAGLEAFGSDFASVRAAFSCSAVLGSADFLAECSDFAGLDDALGSVLASFFATPSWVRGAGLLSERADFACSVSASLDRFAPAEGFAPVLAAFAFFAFSRFAAVFV